MPPLRDTLTQRVFMGSIIKTHMYYKSAFWKEKGFSGQLVDDQGELHVLLKSSKLTYNKQTNYAYLGPISATYDDCDPDGGYFSIMGFLLARHFGNWANATPEQRKKVFSFIYL